MQVPRWAMISVLVAVSISVCSPSFAAQWEPVAETQDETTVLIDIAGIALDKATRRFWLKFDYSRSLSRSTKLQAFEEQKSKLGFGPCGGNMRTTCDLSWFGPEEKKQEWKVDCMGKTITILMSISYDQRGTVVESSREASDPVPIVPDTIGETIVNRVCR